MNSKKTKISKSKKNVVAKKTKKSIAKKFELSEAINSSYRIRSDIFLSYKAFLSKSLADFSDEDLRNTQRLFDHIKETIIKNASKGELTTNVKISNSDDKIHLMMKSICFIFGSLGIDCVKTDFTSEYSFRARNLVLNFVETKC